MSIPTTNSPFYLNVLLLNKDEVVASQVTAKTGFKGNGFLNRAATFAANKMVTDEKIINTLASTLIDKINCGVTEMGISADVKKVFQTGPFVVIRVQIMDIDANRALAAAKGPEFAESFSNLINSLESMDLGDKIPMIREKISQQVQTGMMSKFASLVPLKMVEAGLAVDCNVCASEEQADFFFTMISKFNA